MSMIVVSCSDCLDELHAVGNGTQELFETSVPCVSKGRCPNWPEGLEVEPNMDYDSQMAFSHMAELREAS